jgi:hypothetical protein
MSLGTAIFLSSLVLAAVILYGMTMDRWPWRRIVLGIGRTFALLLLVTAAAGLFFETWWFHD